MEWRIAILFCAVSGNTVRARLTARAGKRWLHGKIRLNNVPSAMTLVASSFAVKMIL
tara:strand:+ start:640 stop:810 length:171 start_codon:yes stop_codon:yes gene_type:complete